MESKLDERGREIPDQTRPEIPLGFKRPETLAEKIRRLVRSEHVRQSAEAYGHETFEEADDFDVGDDFEPSSPYEEVFEVQESPEVERQLEFRSEERRKNGKTEKPKGPTGPLLDSEGSGEQKAPQEPIER